MGRKIFLITFAYLLCFSCFSQTWQTYDSLRVFYQGRQNYDTALVYAEKALQHVKEKTGENDTLYANMLTLIYTLNYEKGNFSQAAEFCKKEIEIRKKIQGEKDIAYATSLDNLGLAYHNMGNYSAAKPLYIEAMNIRKEILGEKNPKYAESLNNLAALYYSMGNFQAAEPLYLEAKGIRKEVLGEKHPQYSTSLNNLGTLYLERGDYSLAEPFYVEAKSIRKEVLGEKHPRYTTSVNNLAYLYFMMGDYSAAEPLYLEAISIRKEVLGEKHPSYATSLNNLGMLYQAMGKYLEAETLYIKSSDIRKDVLGEKSSEYAMSLNNTAELYREMGSFSKAESLFLRASAIWKEVLGEKHPTYATSLANIALLYYKMGNYLDAEPLYQKSVNIRKEVLGERHPLYAQSLFNLSTLYYAMGNYNAAEPLLLLCLDKVNDGIVQNFGFLSEKEKEMYFQTKKGYFDNFYSFAVKRKTENAEITKTAYNIAIKNKGLLLKSSTAMRIAIANSKDTALIAKYEKWIDLKKEIVKLYSTELSKLNKNPVEYEQRANVIEKELVRHSQIFSDYEKLQNLNWESVKNNLKPNEAAIEFIRFAEGVNRDTITYCALILTANCVKPEMIKLFEEGQILDILNSASGNNIHQVLDIYGTNTDSKDSLYQLIWQPLEKYLAGIKTIYFSPDGILHKISFAALRKSKNVFLCDNFNLQQVSSTGKVALSDNTFWNEKLTAGLFGGIEYSTDTTTVKIWNYLPGTKTETDKIAEVFKKHKINTNFFSGNNATEDVFKTYVTHFNILHVSTHGFFYPDPESKVEKVKENVDVGKIIFRGNTSGFGLWQFVKNKNPLMRSGIVLARANNVWNQRYVGSGEDGVLTAQEVTQLDMSKTKLVVLSACETGLGDIKGSEGVYGLQRAFKMAGVKYIIMSLWQVPDKETVEFMALFYKKLLKQKDIRMAFNETQKEMRKKYDPYYWAAFVLVE